MEIFWIITDDSRKTLDVFQRTVSKNQYLKITNQKSTHPILSPASHRITNLQTNHPMKKRAA
jgi:hypothetical protein